MSLFRIARGALALATLIVSATLASRPAYAKPEFAMKEGKNCIYCHTMPGGPRNFRGLYYRAHNHSFAEFDNVYEAKAAGVPADANGEDAVAKTDGYPKIKLPAALSFVLKDIDGKPVNLGRYQGDVIMVVNVASFCGNTPQYASLQKLYDKYKEKGFVVLGIPCNQFNMQEPGTNKEIKEFCTSKYNVTFPMFSKIEVKGDNQTPLYKFLTDKKTDPKFAGDIEWNFAKFLINRKGEVVNRFKAGTDPLKTADIVAAIEKELEEPKDDKGTAAN